MDKFTNYSIVASFLGLWINSFLTDEAQIFIGFLLIFSFGILHGANDLLLIGQTKSNFRNKSSLKILLYYIVVVILGALLFYFVPSIALLLFIIVSGYHFGEQHWQISEHEKVKKINIIFHLLYGLLILHLLFIFHINEVQNIISEITKIHIPSRYFDLVFYSIMVGFLILCIIKYFKSKTFKKIVIQEILLIFVFAIIFKTSTLIWGFTIYFILWHSIPSMIDQMNFLYGSFSLENFKKYFKSAFFYWIISLVGIFSLYLVFRDEYFFNALFFSFLAAITFPHVWVIIHMFKTKKAN
jgi:Brp/Blh family beta-carotene 15,15'-monooxygenase